MDTNKLRAAADVVQSGDDDDTAAALREAADEIERLWSLNDKIAHEWIVRLQNANAKIERLLKAFHEIIDSDQDATRSELREIAKAAYIANDGLTTTHEQSESSK